MVTIYSRVPFGYLVYHLPNLWFPQHRAPDMSRIRFWKEAINSYKPWSLDGWAVVAAPKKNRWLLILVDVLNNWNGWFIDMVVFLMISDDFRFIQHVEWSKTGWTWLAQAPHMQAKSIQTATNRLETHIDLLKVPNLKKKREKNIEKHLIDPKWCSKKLQR